MVSVASHIAGQRIADMVKYFQEGRNIEAARLHREMLPLFRGLFMVANPIPVKAAVNLIGFQAGKPRLPLLPLGEEQTRRLKGLLREYRLIA